MHTRAEVGPAAPEPRSTEKRKLPLLMAAYIDEQSMKILFQVEWHGGYKIR